MKHITFAVPCYNSEAYMEKCLKTLLSAKNDAEIIIVNDGSADGTAAIADAYAKEYPDIVKVHHQENGGHGSGVNYGIQNATGLYFKVVDSDDWLDTDALQQLLSIIKKLHSENNDVDAFFCNYVYEHVSDNTQKSINYRNVFPRNRIFEWKDTRSFRISQYLMMHSLIFRTKMLRDANIELPHHTFYVDNIYLCASLAHVRTMYYLDADLYRYYIGRTDQSVNRDVFLNRLDQHFKITKIVIDNYDMDAARKADRHLERYLTRHAGLLCATGSVYLTVKGDKDSLAQRKQFWKDLKNEHPKLYRDVRRTTFAGLTDIRGKLGNFLISKGLDISQKVFKFN